jgi:hypothetical protein
MRLRNGGAPLLVEKNFGRGRVLAFLSTTSDQWNNWFRASPSFVAFVFNIVPYLSHRFGAGESLLVGEPKTVTFTEPPFEPAVRFTGPGGDALAATIPAVSGGSSVAAAASPEGAAAAVASKGKASGAERRSVTYTKTETAGLYKALLTQPSHKTEDRYFAVNVDPNEGDLRALTGPDLASRLAPLKYEFDLAANFKSKLDETEGRNLGDLFLLILLIVLIVEQLFAWSCSYHVATHTTNPWSPAAKGAPV